MITIQAAGSLKERIPPGTTVPTARTVGEVVAQLPLPRDMGLVMMVNGRLAHWNTELKDGDTLQLAPVVGGGTFHSSRLTYYPLDASTHKEPSL